MAIFVLVHGSTHGPACWDLVRTELEHHGHRVITPELPDDEPDAPAARYADVISSSVLAENRAVLVAHSASGWYLPLVAAQKSLRSIVYLAAIIPRLGMSFVEQLQAEPDMINPQWIGKDPRKPEVADKFLFHDCPPGRLPWAHSTMRVLIARKVMLEPYPLKDWPKTAATYIVCRDDRTIRPEWSRRTATTLGMNVVEIEGGHCPYISRPRELAMVLLGIESKRANY